MLARCLPGAGPTVNREQTARPRQRPCSSHAHNDNRALHPPNRNSAGRDGVGRSRSRSTQNVNHSTGVKAKDETPRKKKTEHQAWLVSGLSLHSGHDIESAMLKSQGLKPGKMKIRAVPLALFEPRKGVDDSLKDLLLACPKTVSSLCVVTRLLPLRRAHVWNSRR